MYGSAYSRLYRSRMPGAFFSSATQASLTCSGFVMVAISLMAACPTSLLVSFIDPVIPTCGSAVVGVPATRMCVSFVSSGLILP